MTVLHAGGKFDNASYKVSRRSPRRRRQRRQRRLRVAQARDQARGQGLVPGVPARRAAGAARGDRRHRQDRHEDHVQARSARSSRSPSSATTSSRAACASSRSSTRASSSRSTDERGEGARRRFEYKGGIREFVEHLNKTKEPVHEKVVHIIAEAPAENGTPIVVEVALQWNSTYAEQIFPYTNNVHNKDGGTHLTGLRAALTRVVQQLRHERRTSSRS